MPEWKVHPLATLQTNDNEHGHGARPRPTTENAQVYRRRVQGRQMVTTQGAVRENSTKTGAYEPIETIPVKENNPNAT